MDDLVIEAVVEKVADSGGNEAHENERRHKLVVVGDLNHDLRAHMGMRPNGDIFARTKT